MEKILLYSTQTWLINKTKAAAKPTRVRAVMHLMSRAMKHQAERREQTCSPSVQYTGCFTFNACNASLFGFSVGTRNARSPQKNKKQKKKHVRLHYQSAWTCIWKNLFTLRKWNAWLFEHLYEHITCLRKCWISLSATKPLSNSCSSYPLLCMPTLHSAISWKGYCPSIENKNQCQIPIFQNSS